MSIAGLSLKEIANVKFRLEKLEKYILVLMKIKKYGGQKALCNIK